jgi:hypothetical protein
MRNFGIAILLIIALFGSSSCRKEQTKTMIRGQAIDTISYKVDTISYKILAPSLQFVCAGNDYLIDLDFDGTPDAKIRLNCVEGAWSTNVNCGPYTYNYTTNIIFDTIFGSQFVPLSNTNKFMRGIFYDTISSSNSIMVFNNDTISQSTVQYAGQTLFLENSHGFLGFVKRTNAGNKYGCVGFYFDNRSNMYVIDIAINNKLNSPIIAGQH